MSKKETQRFKRFPKESETELPTPSPFLYVVSHLRLDILTKIAGYTEKLCPLGVKRATKNRKELGYLSLCSSSFPNSKSCLVPKWQGCLGLTLYPWGTQQINWRVFALSCHQRRTDTTDWVGGFDGLTVYSNRNKLSETKADILCWILAQLELRACHICPVLIAEIAPEFWQYRVFLIFPLK